jgi:fructose-1,6-bisphosphatase-3
MKLAKAYRPENLHYLKMLARQYPTVQAASTEIINLQAILNLPKGTEHFVSDVHGEYEAFLHILNSASGVVREKLDDLFSTSVSRAELDQLATLIYYPKEKLEEISREREDMREFYRITFHRLIEVCRLVSTKYTRSKVRKAMPPEYAYIIDELIHTHYEDGDKRDYYENIISTIIDIDRAPNFLVQLCELIKRLAVDHLHLVGDIFDRGPGADVILDSLMAYHSVDIQWGNHDILWMGAASGSRTLVATVLANSLRYNNLDVIETGYGISLRPLSIFANEVYKDCDVRQFAVKFSNGDEGRYTEKDKLLAARMHKAITMILFKLEGQKILRNPAFGMEDRLLLDKVDYENKCVSVDGVTHPLLDTDFPTVDPKDPYTLTEEESVLIDQLTRSFRHSEKLQRHVRFLYSKGSVYKVYNGNLLFHGCVPMTEDGQLLEFSVGGKKLSGKAFLDYADLTARRAYYSKPGTAEREHGMDFLWFLWAGRNSPIFGRDKMTTFERRFIEDEAVWTEPKNAYYRLYNDPVVCDALLKEFGLEGPHCHIINGHMPVKSKKGESPLKAGGKLLVIDGGFCKAYQKTTGIAGYTLIYNSACFRLVSHEPFVGRANAIRENQDIASSSVVFERLEARMKIAGTDVGRQLQEQIDDLMALLSAYRSGEIVEDHKH